ncbi:MAG: type II secretion system F family protein, partial [Planctomycetaceae bacterium]|nr:type II secretion system F family protein [Planctomycetaceae bacterium]
MGCESGSLPSALQDAVTTVGHYRSVWTSVAGKLIYVIAMLCYGAGILSFVMCCIAPKFGKMFKEFGVVLPGPCRLLISVSDFAVNYWYLSGPFWLALTVFVFHATLRHYGWIQWDLPGIGWFLRRLDAANLMDSLAIVARQERPLLDGITGLARSYPRPSIRRRLARAADDIAAGADWAESLRRCGLIGRADLAILQAAQRAGNLSWALREMAQSSRRRFSYRLQAIAQTAFPAIVVLFGAMVAFIVVALFLPLITLIQAAATN